MKTSHGSDDDVCSLQRRSVLVRLVSLEGLQMNGVSALLGDVNVVVVAMNDNTHVAGRVTE